MEFSVVMPQRQTLRFLTGVAIEVDIGIKQADGDAQTLFSKR